MSELGIGPEHVRQNEQKRVTFVSLRGRNIDDEILRHLAAFEFLNTVDLAGTPVTEECLRNLRELPNLEWLHIGDTQITRAAAREFEKLKPGSIVLQRGEGAIWNPLFKRWVKITRDWWPKSKPWWRFW